jgi:hypothetical protein
MTVACYTLPQIYRLSERTNITRSMFLFRRPRTPNSSRHEASLVYQIHFAVDTALFRDNIYARKITDLMTLFHAPLESS